MRRKAATAPVLPPRAGRIDDAVAPVNGFDLQRSTDLPLMVINALFADFERRGQGVKSNTIGESLYLPDR